MLGCVLGFVAGCLRSLGVEMCRRRRVWYGLLACTGLEFDRKNSTGMVLGVVWDGVGFGSLCSSFGECGTLVGL